MRRGARWSLCSAAAMLLLGCSVQKPDGFERLTAYKPTTVLKGTPWVPYDGGAPWSYDTSDGRKVTLEVLRESVTSRIGLYRADIAFNVGYDGDDGSGHALECSTEPNNPSMPETHFGCWAINADHKTTFWLVPSPGCTMHDTSVSRTLMRPECWRGVLVTDQGRYTMSFGSLESTRALVGYLSWVDSKERPVQAVNSVASTQLRLHRDLQVPLRGADAEVLTLHAVAMHYFWHAMNPG